MTACRRCWSRSRPRRKAGPRPVRRRRPSRRNGQKLDAILEEPSDARKAARRPATHAAEDKIKVSTARLDKLINIAGELVIAQSMVAEEIHTRAKV